MNLVGKRKALQILRRHFLLVLEPGPSICDAIKFSETWCYWAGACPLSAGWVRPCEKCNMRHQNDERYGLQGKETELNGVLCLASTWYEDKPLHMHHPLAPSGLAKEGHSALHSGFEWKSQVGRQRGLSLGFFWILPQEKLWQGLGSHDKSSSDAQKDSNLMLQ